MQLSPSPDVPAQINLGASNATLLDAHVATQDHISKITNHFLDEQLRRMHEWTWTIDTFALYAYFGLPFQTVFAVWNAYNDDLQVKSKIDTLFWVIRTELWKRGLMIWSVPPGHVMRNISIPVVPASDGVKSTRLKNIQDHLAERWTVQGFRWLINRTAMRVSTIWRTP